MTGRIFAKWIRDWSEQLKRKNRKICLLVDNCTAHPTDVKVDNIEIVFLPPNTTSVMQPLDMGIIQDMKAHYRSVLLEHIISILDAKISSSIDDTCEEKD